MAVILKFKEGRNPSVFKKRYQLSNAFTKLKICYVIKLMQIFSQTAQRDVSCVTGFACIPGIPGFGIRDLLFVITRCHADTGTTGVGVAWLKRGRF